MSYCPRCGKEISNEEKGCVYCNQTEPLQELEGKKEQAELSEEKGVSLEKEQPSSTREEEAKGESKKEEENAKPPKRLQQTPPPPKPGAAMPPPKVQSDNLSNGIKVLLAAAVAAVPMVGAVLGLILGLVFMSNTSEDYKSYGKALLILSIVWIGLGIICCLFLMVVSIAGAAATPEVYYNEFHDMLMIRGW